MKHFRRFLSMCIAVAILCGATVGVSADHPFPEEIYPDRTAGYGNYAVYGTLETGIYGTKNKSFPYPITRNFFDYLNHDNYFFDWYNYQYIDGFDRYSNFLAYMWFYYYTETSPEVWCDEYLDKYQNFLAKSTTNVSPLSSEKAQFRVSDYTWEGRTLTAQCEADYDLIYNMNIMYHPDYPNDPKYSYIGIEVPGAFSMGACIALTDKDTGELVHLVKHDSFAIEPDYAYRPGYYHDEFTGLDQDLIAEKTSGTSTLTFEMTIPERYDPEKYNATLYFFSIYDDTMLNRVDWISKFYNPSDVTYNAPVPTIPGDVDGDGEMSAADVATLSRYLSGGEVAIADSADITADGKIVVNDLATIRRLLSGGEL